VDEDIRAKLLSSDAVESLRMELFVAQCFKERHWPAQQGVYYTDTETGKSREIDVLSRQLLQDPERSRKVGGPIINLSVICECKSLSGHNVIVLPYTPEEFSQNNVWGNWLGYERHIAELVETLGSTPHYAKANKRALYSYYTERAYPGDKALTWEMRLDPPPIDFNATTFRETKGGADRKKEQEGASSQPLWSAIRSVLSATNALDSKFLDTMRSYTSGRSSLAYDAADAIKYDAYFFDLELLRRVCFHPVIFCKARIFHLENDELKEIKSTRIFIQGFDLEVRYVDIVHFGAARDYIRKMTAHFERKSKMAFRKTAKILEGLGWSPGQQSLEFAKVAGLHSKKRSA
jgi:hypothetical protein